jgi:hypothetical protein
LSGHTSIFKTILLQFCPGDLFAAISTLLGSPIIGAFLLEASGLDGLLLGLRGRGKNRTGGDHRIGSAGAADRRGRGRHGSGAWIMISVVTSTTIQTAIAAAPL